MNPLRALAVSSWLPMVWVDTPMDSHASRLAVNVIAERVVRDLLLSPLNAESSSDSPKQWDEEASAGTVTSGDRRCQYSDLPGKSTR